MVIERPSWNCTLLFAISTVAFFVSMLINSLKRRWVELDEAEEVLCQTAGKAENVGISQ